MAVKAGWQYCLLAEPQVIKWFCVYVQAAHADVRILRSELAAAAAEVSANLSVAARQRKKQGFSELLATLVALQEASQLHAAFVYGCCLLRQVCALPQASCICSGAESSQALSHFWSSDVCHHRRYLRLAHLSSEVIVAVQSTSYRSKENGHAVHHLLKGAILRQARLAAHLGDDRLLSPYKLEVQQTGDSCQFMCNL